MKKIKLTITALLATITLTSCANTSSTINSTPAPSNPVSTTTNPTTPSINPTTPIVTTPTPTPVPTTPIVTTPAPTTPTPTTPTPTTPTPTIPTPSTPTPSTPDVINTKDLLKDIKIGDSFDGDVVIAGKRGNDFYVEDQTGGAFVYLNKDTNYNSLQVGDQVNLQGTVVEFKGAGIIQISTVTAMTKIKSGCALKEPAVTSISDIDSHRMGRITIKGLTLASKSIVAGTSSDSKITLSLNGSTITGFIGKRLGETVKNQIDTYFSTIPLNATVDIIGAFADYYQNPQIAITDVSQVVVNEAALTFADKVKIIENSVITPLDNSNVRTDIVLPTSSLYDSTISWNSSNTSLLSNEGKVTRPSDEDKQVTLTYTIAIGGDTTTKSITVIVKKVLENGDYEYTYVEPNYSGTYYTGIDDGLRGRELILELDDLLDSTSHPNITFSYSGNMENVFPYTDGDGSGKMYAFYRGTLQSRNSMNREHVWPKSRGGDCIDADPHMTRPTLTSDNSSRGNNFYNETQSYDPGEYGAYQYRGIAARIIFYCAVKAQENGLKLADLTNDSTGNKTMGKLSTLLKWNLMYDIDHTEVLRNDTLYTRFKHNRNPFIDDRNYACKIWGDTNEETRTVCSANY